MLQEAELQLELNSPEDGLFGFLVIDSTRLGPSAGGIRLRSYTRPQDALTDAKRLARAMTLKAALAGLPFGGAKTAICFDPNVDRMKLFAAIARKVDELQGSYICGQDVGVTQTDIAVVKSLTPYVAPDVSGSLGSALCRAGARRSSGR